MNLIDFLVIYLAVGAPFAVSYFLRNRRRSEKSFAFWLKIFAVFVFWLPFAVFSLYNSKNFFRFFKPNYIKNLLTNDSSRELSQIQKQIENILLKSGLPVSTFDYRETVERYVGLTTACEVSVSNNFESEIFYIAKTDNSKLGSICLQRRNRIKLVRHQSGARLDFLRIVERILESSSDAKLLQEASFKLAKILKDETAQEELEKMFSQKLQTEKLSSVKPTENELWKPQEHKPLRTETISTRS